MTRRLLRIATTAQLERSVRQAGFDAYVLPPIPTDDFHRPLAQRLSDGEIHRPFLEKHDIDLVLDFNTAALTLTPSPDVPGQVSLTTAILGIPYVACYLDPITSTMNQVPWLQHWHILESPSWIKWIYETAHSQELLRLGVPNVLTLPMAVADDDFHATGEQGTDTNPVVAFMGHPASSWFRSHQPIAPSRLFPGLTAAAVRADLPDLTFHKIYYDLYAFAEPPSREEEITTRANKAADYYNQKFAYNAYLAVKQRDRFARFLKLKLGDLFELIGDHWGDNYGLSHTPRIWDMKTLHERMRRVPICLNLMKGGLETGLNVRHFEITAHGGFMLTYPTAELSSCFEIGTECDVFHDEAELLDKIQFYLANPEKRREIAEAGRRRTLAQHLYSHRIARLVTLLREAGVLSRTVSSASAPITAIPQVFVRGVNVETGAIPVTGSPSP
ncbi:MAG: glycosyltransferase [Planctomycetota bacterium]